MAPNIALLCWKRLAYALYVEILGTSVCLMLMLKFITVLQLAARCFSATNVMGSGFDVFIGSSVFINDLLVFDTFNR
jgi:hypothetical protein